MRESVTRICALLERIANRLDTLAERPAPSTKGLSLQQAADALGCSIRHLSNLEKSKALTIARVGNRRVVDSREIDRLLRTV